MLHVPLWMNKKLDGCFRKRKQSCLLHMSLDGNNCFYRKMKSYTRAITWSDEVSDVFSPNLSNGWRETDCTRILVTMSLTLNYHIDLKVTFVKQVLCTSSHGTLHFSHTPDRDIPWLHPCGICLSHTLVSGIRRPDVGWTAHKWSY